MESRTGYIRNFFKDKQVASITPSSKFSVRYLKNKIDFARAEVIVEYGAGNGVFSDMFAENMKTDSKLILFETNADFAKLLEEKYADDKRVFVTQSNALDVEKVLKDFKISEVDYIVTGIPFTFLDDNQRVDLVKTSHTMLKDGGRFISYQFSMTVNKYVKNQFGDMKLSVQPLNIPPLLVVEGVKAS